MFDTEIARSGTLAIYVIDVLLLLGLVTLKVVHRQRARRHDARRHRYLAVLSQHVSGGGNDPVTPEMAEDPAFLDALIDIRDVLSGHELDPIETIVARHGVSQTLARRLESRFPLGRRLRAAVALAEIGDVSAVSTMIKHLSDPEPEIRVECARGLARLKWTPAIDHIVDRFSVEVPSVRARFADSLVGFGSKATWPLLAYVRVNHGSDSEGPALALRTVGRVRDLSATRPILGILAETKNLEVELAAVEALGRMGSPESLETLQMLIEDTRWQMRAKAAAALGEVPDVSSVPILSNALRDLNWWVRRGSASALVKVPGGVDALYAALDDDDPYAADAAAEALADAGELVAARHRLRVGDSEREPLIVHMGREA